MDVLVAYDVATETADGRRRLRKVANVCLAYGQRVQKSVFECSLTETQSEDMESRLLDIIDLAEDNLRVYRLREPRERFVRSYGRDAYVNFRGPLIG